MSLIKIIANDIELQIVKESLTIRNENNSLINDYKVSYSAFPFLIVDNANTIKALGSRDITSINKKKTIIVTVFQGEEKFLGYLEQLSFINGFRKCNLKFAGQILSILQKKLPEFMPVESVFSYVDPDAPIIPFSEETLTINEQDSGWIATNNNPYKSDRMLLEYPEVKWQLPTIYDINRYGDDQLVDGDFAAFNNILNKYGPTGFLEKNFFVNDPGNVIATNRNVPSPQVYLLAPIFYAFDSIGYKITGNFVNDSFIKKILLLSEKDNLSKAILTGTTDPIFFIGSAFFPGIAQTPYAAVLQNEYELADLKIITRSFQVNQAGDYKFKYDFRFDWKQQGIADNFASLYVVKDVTGEYGECFNINVIPMTGANRKGEFDFTFLESEVGTNFTIVYGHFNKEFPKYYTMEIGQYNVEKNYYWWHPTVDLGRYVPDWTLSDYINQIKKLFNVKVTENDTEKTISFDFCESIYKSVEKLIVKQSFKRETEDLQSFNVFELGYQEDDDNTLQIRSNGVSKIASNEIESVFSVKSKFKFVPFNNLTSQLTEEFKDNRNVGLMILDPSMLPYTSDQFDDKRLDMVSIHKQFWKVTIQSRLKATIIKVSGYFTPIEAEKIIKAEKVYFDKQEFIITSSELKETSQNNFEMTFNSESVCF